jgi:hypothetical protein
MIQPRDRAWCRWLVRAAVLVGLMASTPIVAGGSGASGIIVEPPIAHPGDEISIHGENLWTDATVTVSVVGRAGATRALPGGITGGNGTLELRARLPEDLPAGRFQIIVTNEAGEQVGTELIVEPAVPVVPIAIALAALGAVALVAISARRRQRTRRDDAHG